MSKAKKKIKIENNKIIETIAIEDDPEEHLLTIINNRKRLDRIIRELDPIWPDENSSYDISFSYKGKKRDFYPRRKPINVEVEFENEQYIFSEDKLKLLVVAKTIEGGITGIKEELTSIWEDYILANEQELNGDAIEFKKYLLSLIKGRD
jgi:hypothetical protein